MTETLKHGRSHVNKIKCFQCKKLGHIATNCFANQKYKNKRAIKAKVTISDSTNNDNKDNTNLLVFIASKNLKDPPTVALKVQKIIAKDDDEEEDEFIDTYNELLLKHIKSKK